MRRAPGWIPHDPSGVKAPISYTNEGPKSIEKQLSRVKFREFRDIRNDRRGALKEDLVVLETVQMGATIFPERFQVMVPWRSQAESVVNTEE